MSTIITLNGCTVQIDTPPSGPKQQEAGVPTIITLNGCTVQIDTPPSETKQREG